MTQLAAPVGVAFAKQIQTKRPVVFGARLSIVGVFGFTCLGIKREASAEPQSKR